MREYSDTLTKQEGKRESIINFSLDREVMFNPHNHGHEHAANYTRVKNKKGKVINVVEISRQVTVLWHGKKKPRDYHYQRLLIVS